MKICSLSNIGLIRSKNQDNYLTVYNKNGDLLALVCDGIGGNKAGEVASFEIVRYFENIFKNNHGFKDDEEIITYLKYHVKVASNHVHDLSLKNEDYEGMGTTITGILISSLGNFVINAGDSRVYGLYNHELVHLTKDHTLVNELIDRKMITKEEALSHPKRHYLTKFLGVYDGLGADVYKVMNRYTSYLICSDGLHGYVSKEEIKEVLMNQSVATSLKPRALLNLALKAGGYDNITIILIEIEKGDN